MDGWGQLQKRWPARLSFLLVPLVLPLESMAIVLQCYESLQPQASDFSFCSVKRHRARREALGTRRLPYLWR
jgi:hypothetical protein